MKITSFRLAAVAFVALAISFVWAGKASAVDVSVQFGTPPPPPPAVVGRPWARPYRGAVWIAPHYELIHRRWVWVDGYYTYPPRPGGYWVPGRYRHGNYYPGHWAW